MVTIGNDTLPGTITTIESAASSSANIGAPALPVLIGQAYLSGSNASADANTAYRVTRPRRARELFGNEENSMLTKQVQDALVAGAYPVYAIAPEETSVTAEDLSGVSGQSTTLANAPLIENASDITFTINSTEKDTVLYYDGDPENASPDTDEVYVNPQSGKAYADEAMGNTGDEVDYIWADYANTFDEVTNATAIGSIKLREVADFLAIVDENDSVIDSSKTKSESMEQNGWFNITVAGAGQPYIVDQAVPGADETTSYSNSYDTSRVQLIYPSRDENEDSIMGSYIGLRSSLGISASPMFKRLDAVSSLNVNLSQAEQENLVAEQVNPIDETGTTAKIIEDLTTVTDSNTDEAAWQRGFARLVTDFTTQQVNRTVDPYVGEFHNTPTKNTIRSNVASILKSLLKSYSITGFSLVIESIDSVTLAVDVGINTTSVLRNIELTVTAGSVQNGVTASVQ